MVSVGRRVVEAADLLRQCPVLLLRGGGPGLRRVPRRDEPVDLGLRRPCTGAGRAEPPGQPGQSLAPVGDGPRGVPQPALLLSQRPLQLRPVLGRVLQRPRGRFQSRRQFRLLLTDPRGLPFHVLGIAAAPLLLGRSRGALDPRVRQGGGPPDAFGELRQLVPGLLRPLQPRCELPYRLLQLRLAPYGARELGLGGLLALLERRLVRDLRVEGAPQHDQVVGEQPQPGVAQVRLDHGRPPGDRRLPSQGLELAPQLVAQVLDAREVGLHRVQLPQRLLLALAVLEYAGRLLDEGAAAHGIGVQYGVQLALSDDDVHLAADAGVGEQFLDVEQAAGVTVDLVLAAAAAEHDPGDGDFGVVDGERAVGVVDRQGHLGPSERRTPGGPGEDDVLHLPAAQGLGPLFAHDPGERVHHIGLAGAVRAHDTGDSGLEAQGGGGREGFEATQGQGLEVHAAGLYLSRSVSPMKVLGTTDANGIRPPTWPCGAWRGGGGKRAREEDQERKKGRRSVPCRSCGAGVERRVKHGSGERRLRLGYVDVDAAEQRVSVVLSGGRVQRVIFGLNPYELGLEVLDALLKPSHLGEESRVGTADVTEKRLCHDGWSSTLSDRPKRCGS